MSYKYPSVCLKYSALAIFLLFFQTGFGQFNSSDLDAELQNRQKLLGNDLVVMVWNKDSSLYKKELGSFNSKTVAPIASSSKWLTAALVMQFVDEGKLDLDDKVAKWIPAFESYGKNYVTIRHCLTHQTGIKDETGFFKQLLQRRKFASLEEEVNKLAARDIRSNAGTDFWYGHIGPVIAARVLEILSKRKFDLLIKQKLFNPLGMRKTSFSTMDNSAPNPAGGAVSTADDYMRFLVMLLNNGKHEGKQIISEESISLLKEIHIGPDKMKYAPKVAEGLSYAPGGWVVEQKNGKTSALAAPGLGGVWPMIDFCRGYAYLVMVKNLLTEEKAISHMELKKVVDQQFPACN
jgi:CubicO group peptidase (beta-lactamase class C family)